MDADDIIFEEGMVMDADGSVREGTQEEQDEVIEEMRQESIDSARRKSEERPRSCPHCYHLFDFLRDGTSERLEHTVDSSGRQLLAFRCDCGWKWRGN